MPNKQVFSYMSVLLFTLVIAACTPKSSTLTETFKKKVIQQHLFVIKNVNVITMVPGAEIMSNTTVIIDSGKIVSLNGPIPDHAEIIDGKGKWLIPGLMDMHVHIPTDGHYNTWYPTRAAVVFKNTQDVMTPFVANGVTTVFDLNSRAGHFGQRNEILRGDVIGPRMALSAMIEGGDQSNGRIANTPADGRMAVRMAKAEGYEFIKTYSKLDRETYKAIVDEAGKQGMKVIGHIPNAFQGKLEEAFVPHFDMSAHAEEFSKHTETYTEEDAKRFAKLAKDNGTWVCPTLVIIVWASRQSRSLDDVKNLPSLPYVHPLLQSKWLTANNYNKGTNPTRVAHHDKMVAFHKNYLVKAFKEAGVPMVAGTDAGSSGVVWGFSLHEELELMVGAGLTPYEVLESATRLPATWLGIDSIVGTITPGKYADLVLLDANPLVDIKNTQKIAGVFVNGKWLSKSTIDAMLADLSRRNNAMKSQWDWSKRSQY